MLYDKNGVEVFARDSWFLYETQIIAGKIIHADYAGQWRRGLITESTFEKEILPIIHVWNLKLPILVKTYHGIEGGKFERGIFELYDSPKGQRYFRGLRERFDWLINEKEEIIKINLTCDDILPDSDIAFYGIDALIRSWRGNCHCKRLTGSVDSSEISS